MTTNFKYKGVDLADIIDIQSFSSNGKYSFTPSQWTSGSTFRKYTTTLNYIMNGVDIGQNALLSNSKLIYITNSVSDVVIPAGTQKIRYFFRSGSGGAGGSGGLASVNAGDGAYAWGHTGGWGGTSGITGGDLPVGSADRYYVTIGEGGAGGEGGAAKMNDNFNGTQVGGHGANGAPGGTTLLGIFNSSNPSSILSTASVAGGGGGGGGLPGYLNTGQESNGNCTDPNNPGYTGSTGPNTKPSDWSEIQTSLGGAPNSRGMQAWPYPGNPGNKGYGILIMVK